MSTGSGKHILVVDWVSDSFDDEKKLFGQAGHSVAISGVDHAQSIEQKKETLIEAIHKQPRIDVLMFCIAPIDQEVIDLLPDTCGLLQRVGTGLDNVDLNRASERGMEVRNTPNYCVEEVAVHAMSMLLSLHRQLSATQQNILGGGWSGKTPKPVHRLSTQTLGIMGFGRIGRRLGQWMRPLVSKVIYWDELTADSYDWAEQVTLDELLAEADLISLHLPLTPQTRGIIGSDSLAKMKETALLVNAARGALVDAAHLAVALNNDRLGGAGLDVFDPEILPDDSPLRTAKNIILTSHTAWYSEDSIQDSKKEATQSVLEFLG